VRGSNILLLGAGGREDPNHATNSQAGALGHLLAQKGAILSYHHPVRATSHLGHQGMTMTVESEPLTVASLHSKDLAIVIGRDSGIDWEFVLSHIGLIVDTCRATPDWKTYRDRIVEV
jgi:UDP-N-acetyl-D-glucosamine dehydrogenase